MQNYENNLLAIRAMPFIQNSLNNQSILEIKGLNEAPSESKKSYKRFLEYSGSEHEDLGNL